MKALRRLLWAGISLLAVFVLVVVTVFSLDMYRRSRAQRLIEDVRALRVAESSLADVQKLTEKYGKTPPMVMKFNDELETPECAPPNCTDFAFEVQSPLTLGVTNHPAWFGSLGLRAWVVRAGARVEEGRVSSTGAGVFVRRPDGCWLLATAMRIKSLERRAETMPDWDESDEHIERGAYYISGGLFHIDPEHGDVLSAQLAPMASPAAQQHAFEVNWYCVGTFHGCRELCELYPKVWADWRGDQLRRGRDITPAKGRSCPVPGGACACSGGCEEKSDTGGR